MGRSGRGFDEALGMGGEGDVEGDLAGGVNCVGLAVVHLVRGRQPEAGMVMRIVIPCEEFPTELFGILDAAEAFREPWLIFRGLEVAF